MQCNVMREQPLGVLQPISSRGLHENITRSWRGMEDAHLKILKHFLLDGCMRLSYQILRLGYLHSRYIYIYNVTDRNKEAKAEGKRFNQILAD